MLAKLGLDKLELGFTTHKQDDTEAIFYNDQVVALINNGIVTIFPTKSVVVSELYNMMLSYNDSDLQFSFNDSSSYLTDPLLNKCIIDKHFSFKLKEGK